jgi:hypothetical protein
MDRGKVNWMDGWMDGQMRGWMDERAAKWMDGWMDESVGGWIDGRIDGMNGVCMHGRSATWMAEKRNDGVCVCACVRVNSWTC